MLDINTFMNGITIVKKCYKGFELDSDEISTWYEIIKSAIDEDAFLPLVFNYCKSESAPTCPADIIKFGKKVLTDAAPAPSVVANELVNSVKRMLIEDYSIGYDDNVEDNKQNFLNDTISRNPILRLESIYVVVVNLVNNYYEVLVDAVIHNDRTEISILTSEIKSSYRKELDNTVSRTVLTANAIEGMTPLLLK